MSELHTRIGRLLKTERERQNKSLADMAQDLKIAEGHLLAIEAGDVGGVPSELYFKLFARSYSDALGLDYQKVIELIREEMHEPANGTPDGEPDRPASPRLGRSSKVASREQGKGTFWIIAGVAVLILAAVSWLIFSKQDALNLGGKENENVQVSDSGRTEENAAALSSANRENMALSLDLVARDRTWALVIADGDTTLQTNLKPWRDYYVGARDSLIVSIGSPLAVELTLNGTRANMSDPEDGSISSVVITPENVSMFIQRALEDSLKSLDSLRDSIGQDTTGGIRKDTTKGLRTGSSPVKSASSDSATIQKGTGNGN